MGKCRNHPDRETNYICSKHNVYLCEECLRCMDPDLYCKFRTACPIWFMDKKKAGLDEEKEVEEVKNKYRIVFKPENNTTDVYSNPLVL